MFVYHFVDPDLRVEIYFEKERSAENGGVNFEIGNIDTSAYLYWRLKKTPWRACLRFFAFLVTKNQLFKALLTSTFIPSLLNSFDLPSYSSESKKKYTQVVVYISRDAEGRVLFFSWERLGGGQQETIFCNKVVPEDLKMKFRSKSDHGFVNRGCLHCAILKALYGFKR